MSDEQATTQEKNKESSGKIATFVWIGSGIYLFATTSHANFLSWQAAVFFIPGMFVAAVLLGSTFYILMDRLSTGIAKLAGPPPIAPPVAALISFISVLLLAGHAVVGYLAARWAFNWLVG
jgi:hypothetical protein